MISSTADFFRGCIEESEVNVCPVPFLPSIKFNSVSVHSGTVHDESPSEPTPTRVIFSCAHTGNSYGLIGEIQRCNTGSVFYAAKVHKDVRGLWFWVKSALSPYPNNFELVCIKQECRVKVAENEKQKNLGFQVDDSMLDKALVLSLQDSTPGIPRILECWVDKAYWYSLSVFANHGEVRTFRGFMTQGVTRPGTLNEDEAKVVVREVAMVLKLLHESGWCHKDVSPENILLGPNYQPMLIDFGCAEPMVEASVSIQSTAAQGSGLCEVQRWAPFPSSQRHYAKIQYAPPEYINKQPWYGVSYDLFSLGITLYLLLFGEMPYSIWVPGIPTVSGLIEGDEILRARGWKERKGGTLEGIRTGSSYGSGSMYGKDVNGGTINPKLGMKGSDVVGGTLSPPHSPTAPLIDHPLSFSSPPLDWPSYEFVRVSSFPPPVPSSSSGEPSNWTPFECFLATQNARRAAEGRGELSHSVLELISQLIRVNPFFRLSSVSELLKHSWFCTHAS